ncbi:hypothetical protein [Streptomyces sp. NPDC097610]|uniref:hypothetical protein n=1 Tax=Streptomyces sp. NPDC097610 TaxID=3157227 RepID=UPI00331BD0A9
MSHQPPPQPGGRPEAWTTTDRFSPEQANALAQKAEITQSARNAYIAAHVVSDATAEQQIRQLLARILQTGRLALKQSGCRARSHKADGEGDDSYTFILDRGCRRVIKYSGPPTSWFDKEIRIPVGDLLAMLDERRRKELEAERRKEHQREAQEQRQEAHEQRMRTQRAEAEARRAAAIPAPAWPLLPPGQAYDGNGQSVPLPSPRRPIRDESTIRRVGRRPYVLFHADALNSPFFRNVAPEKRHEAIRKVVDKLLRAPTKGQVVVGPECITVTGQKVTFTLTPDCAMVRSLNPPRPGNNAPASYRADRWKVPRSKERE